jgi:hypothetical protein
MSAVILVIGSLIVEMSKKDKQKHQIECTAYLLLQGILSEKGSKEDDSQQTKKPIPVAYTCYERIQESRTVCDQAKNACSRPYPDKFIVGHLSVIIICHIRE